MKGIVFSEFLDWAEAEWKPEKVDQAIVNSDLSNEGAYTTVGTYNHQELLRIISELTVLTGTPASEMVREFGRRLFRRFYENYPDFFIGVTSAFDFLLDVENHIHVEVLKLYPDAELPHFEYQRHEDGSLEILYRSDRRLDDLAEGLVLGCIDHFGQPIELKREPLGAEGGHSRFVLKAIKGAVPCLISN